MVSENLTFVERKEVAESPMRALVILAPFDGESGFPVAREELGPGDHRGGIMG